MSRVVVVHGIHAAEGQSNVWRLKPYLELQGHAVEVFEYGYTTAFMAYWRNPGVARRLAETHGDAECDFVCHSNGAAVLYLAMRDYGLKAGRASLINPALDSWRLLSGAQYMDIYYNAYDAVVGLAGLLPGNVWGRMGADGWTGPADPTITNIDCANTPFNPRVSGHLDFFTPGKLDVWGRFLAKRHGSTPCNHVF